MKSTVGKLTAGIGCGFLFGTVAARSRRAKRRFEPFGRETLKRTGNDPPDAISD